MGDLTNITLNGKPLAMHNQIKKAATAQTLDVCQHAEDSVTLCDCGKAAKKKYCSGACRQKAYRTSAAFLANKKRWEDARMARRADHYQRRNRSRALRPVARVFRPCCTRRASAWRPQSQELLRWKSTSRMTNWQ